MKQASKDKLLEPLGASVLDMDMGEYISLKHLGVSPHHSQTYRNLYDEIKISSLRYILAMMHTLYGRESSWASQRKDIISFVRQSLASLLRTYAGCIRAALTKEGTKDYAACCESASSALPSLAAATLPATCEHALAFLMQRTEPLLSQLRSSKRRSEAVQLATSDEAREHFAAVVRALVKMNLLNK